MKGRSGRVGIVVVMVLSLLLAGMTRTLATSMRRSDVLGGDAPASGSLSNMNSFALVLLLGGLRGPLVMILWTQSETLKNEKNLEDFDTYVEWIRLLQPEFDTVHIFQVWNKAYNVSVQMASWANKYATILDAINYAQKVLAQRPNDINMVFEIGKIYSDKLGGSSEKEYYKERVRRETLPHEDAPQAERQDPSWRPTKLEPVLDANGNILPQFLKPRWSRPANVPANSEWNDGSELQYLAQYQPFPYGLSTLALGYNYHKQAEILQSVGKQRHANLSDVVIDSRPALALKEWSEDEWARGRRFEMQAFNEQIPTERTEMEAPTASLALDTPFSERSLVEKAIYSYDLGARVSRDALGEYDRHLRGFSINLGTYQSHIDGIKAQEALMLGDRDYLKAMLTKDSGERKTLLASAAEHYRDSAAGNLLIVLRYYMVEEMAPQILGKGMSRSEIPNLSLEQRLEAYGRLKAVLKTMQYDSEASDRADYEHYFERAQSRLKRIDAAK